MSWSITKADADTYFGINNDIRHWEWTSFSDGIRTAAIAQAKREIESALGAELSDVSISTTNTGYRPDYAVFEQAIWTLKKSDTKFGKESLAVVDLTKDEEKNESSSRKEKLLSPKAQRYLQLNFVKMVRG
jgi:hypothetical protein